MCICFLLLLENTRVSLTSVWKEWFLFGFLMGRGHVWGRKHVGYIREYDGTIIFFWCRCLPPISQYSPLQNMQHTRLLGRGLWSCMSEPGSRVLKWFNHDKAYEAEQMLGEGRKCNLTSQWKTFSRLHSFGSEYRNDVFSSPVPSHPPFSWVQTLKTTQVVSLMCFYWAVFVGTSGNLT